MITGVSLRGILDYLGIFGFWDLGLKFLFVGPLDLFSRV